MPYSVFCAFIPVEKEWGFWHDGAGQGEAHAVGSGKNLAQIGNTVSNRDGLGVINPHNAFRKERHCHKKAVANIGTEAPIPIPIQNIWKRLINWLACEEAESCAFPILLSIMISIRLMPTVRSCCNEIRMAIWVIAR